VAVGPTHFDFRCKKGKNAGRIKFDAKFSQIIKLGIRGTKLVCNLEHNLTERMYLYNMYLLDGKNRTRSEMSKTFDNQLLNMGLFDKVRYGRNPCNESSVHLDEGKPKEKPAEQPSSPLYNLHSASDKDIHKLDPADKRFVSMQDIAVHHPDAASIEAFNWSKLKNSIDLSKLQNTNQEEDQPLVASDSKLNEQKDIMVQIARSLARASTSKPVDFQKLNEKQDLRKMVWEETDCVHIDVTISMANIANASLQFCVWANKTTEEKGTHKIILESKLIGETYINVATWFKEHTGEKYSDQSKVKSFETKLWLHGINVGSIKGDICVTTSPYLRQLVCGVLTESGMGKNRSAFIKDEEEQASKLIYRTSPKIKQMIKLKDDLISCVYQHLGKTKNKAKNKLISVDNIKRILNELKVELEKSDKTSMTSFVYENKGELLIAQQNLIEVGRHLTEVLDEMDEELKELYFRNGLIVLNRGELFLSNLSFSDKQKLNVDSKGKDSATKSKSLKFKVKLGLSYQRLLYECLVISLNILNQKVRLAHAGPAEVRARLHRVLLRLRLLPHPRVPQSAQPLLQRRGRGRRGRLQKVRRRGTGCQADRAVQQRVPLNLRLGERVLLLPERPAGVCGEPGLPQRRPRAGPLEEEVHEARVGLLLLHHAALQLHPARRGDQGRDSLRRHPGLPEDHQDVHPGAQEQRREDLPRLADRSLHRDAGQPAAARSVLQHRAAADQVRPGHAA